MNKKNLIIIISILVFVMIVGGVSYSYFVYNKDNDNYLSVILSEFDSADDDNRDEKIALCNELSYTMKVVKFNVIQRVIIASYEFFFLNEDDLKYHVTKSLNLLVAAKNNYNKHKNN